MESIVWSKLEMPDPSLERDLRRHGNRPLSSNVERPHPHLKTDRLWLIQADQMPRFATAKQSSRVSPQSELLGAGQPPVDGREQFLAALVERTMPVEWLERTSCREPLSGTQLLVLASILRQRQISTAVRSLACQSSTSLPARSRRSALPATQVVRRRTLLALGATNVGGSPATSTQGRSSKPDATFHLAHWAAQAAKRVSRDPPRLPRDRHRPEADTRRNLCAVLLEVSTAGKCMAGNSSKRRSRPGVDKYGRTPLHYAAGEGHRVEVVRLGPEADMS